MIESNIVAQEIRNFIVANFLYGQERAFGDEDSFMAAGIVDSTGVLQLVAFIEETYGIAISDEELIPENLDSIASVAAYVRHKVDGTVDRPISAGETVLGEMK